MTDITQYLDNLREELLEKNTSRRNQLINKAHNPRTPNLVRIIDEDPNFIFDRLVNKNRDFKLIPLPDPSNANLNQIISEEEKNKLSNDNLISIDEETSVCKWIEEDNPDERARDIFHYIKPARWARALKIKSEFEVPQRTTEELGSAQLDRDLQTLFFERELIKKTRALKRKANRDDNEKGVKSLYLALGFLEWYDNKGNKNVSPLVLIPVSMEVTRLGKAILNYSGDDVETNRSLVKCLERQDRPLELPELDSNKDEVVIDEYFEELSNRIQDRDQWKIRRYVSISIFNLTEIEFYLDLDPRNWGSELIEENEFLQLATSEEERESYDPANLGEYNIEVAEMEKRLDLVLNADPSQYRAIRKASDGSNLVVSGPPGTGKSQTISNMIAQFISQDQTVLFVSDKKVALDVVKRNLDKEGLGQLCFSLLGNSRDSIEDLKTRNTQKLSGIVNQDSVNQKIRDNVTERKALYLSLEDHVRLMKEEVSDSTLSAFDILSRSGGLRKKLQDQNVNTNDLNTIASGLELTREQSNVQLDLITEYKITLEQIATFGSVKDHPWFGWKDDKVMGFEIDNIVKKLKSFKESISELLSKTKILEGLTKDNLDEISSIQCYKDFTNRLQEQNINLDEAQFKIFAKNNFFDVFKALETYETRYLPAREKITQVLPNIHDVETKKFNELIENYESISPLSDKARHLKKGELVELINNYIETIDNYLLSVDAIKLLAKKLEIENVSSFDSFRLLGRMLGFFESHKEFVPEIRDDLFYNQALDDELDFIESSIQRLKHNRTELESFLNTGSLTESSMQIHYQALHTSNFLKKFWWNKEYRDARAFLSKATSTAKKQNFTQRLKHFDDYFELIKSENKIDNSNKNKRLLGDYFLGVNTNIDDLIKVRAFYKDVADEFKGVNHKFGQKILQLNTQEFMNIANSVDSDLRKKIINLYDETKEFFTINELSLSQKKGFFSSESLKKIKKSFGYIVGSLDQFLPDFNLYSLAKIKKSFPKYVESKQIIESKTKNELLDLNSKNCADQIEVLKEAQAIFQAVEECGIDSLRALFAEQGQIKEMKELYLCIVSLVQAFEAFNNEKEKFYASGEVNQMEWNGSSTEELFSIKREEQKCLSAIENHKSLIDWIRYQKVSKNLTESPSAQIKDAYEGGRIELKDLSTTMQYIYYQSLALELIRKEPGLRDFDGKIFENKRARFQKLDREYIDLIPPRILSMANRKLVPEGAGARRVRDKTNMVYLDHEFAKQRGYFPPRTMMRQSIGAIQALKPCFMMRPTDVAKYLKRGKLFDVVIMDESSQITPEKAIGSLLRAEQYILAGDTKQLPPTSFFQIAVNANDEEEQDFADDSESILEQAEKIISHSNQVQLQWHYRSEHHSLISFSNHYFYDDSLKIFCSPSEQNDNYGVTSQFIEGAQYISGPNKRYNTQEAEAVVDAVIDHMRYKPSETLMVVTMNLPQREEIQRIYEDQFADPRNAHMRSFEELRANDPRKEIFEIKNLENVQGDERDVIFISYTYGPDVDTGTIRQNFRFVGRENGWRPLNVLFTRAKKRIKVFTSLLPSDVKTEVGGFRNKGKAAFRDYLEFAETGNIRGVTNVRGEPENEFEEAIGSALGNLGFKIDFQVGFIGFRIDMAVKHPDDEGKYILGIEADGATYHSTPSARARDRLRQEILENKGWEIARVWSTDWFNDPESEIRKILTRIQSLLSQEQEESEGEQSLITETIEEDRDPVVESLQEEEDEQSIFSYSRDETRELLINYRETEIKPKYPSNLEKGILRKSSLNALLFHLPTTHQQYLNRIAYEIRLETDPDQGSEFLDTILTILSDCDPESPFPS